MAARKDLKSYNPDLVLFRDEVIVFHSGSFFNGMMTDRQYSLNLKQ
jgi:hypothetical protein